MKFLDFLDLLKAEAAHLAMLSTFAFDVEFFERKVLRAKALAKARRIIVFVDARQWHRLVRREPTARLLNRRYLLLPVRPKKGCFHPKLHLFVQEQGGQVICGSNNLTRRGCTNNLELLNSLPFTAHDGPRDHLTVGQDAFDFFQRACDDVDPDLATIAKNWIDESRRSIPWLNITPSVQSSSEVRLIHTYSGSLWEALRSAVGPSPPKNILVVSPFYDADGELIHRAAEAWPRCHIEVVGQQETSTLPVSYLASLGRRLGVSEIRCPARHLHAKLVAWTDGRRGGCIVGSANFTTAAFDAANVEACLLLTDSKGRIQGLFDRQLPKVPIALEDFTPGAPDAPEADEQDSSDLVLRSAVLTAEGTLRVAYSHNLPVAPEKLRIAISLPGQTRPHLLRSVPVRGGQTHVLPASERLGSDSRGAIVAWLHATVGGQTKSSAPTWVVQEAKLTHEFGNGYTTNPQAVVEQSGVGLIELLDEIGQRDGLAGVVERLSNLTIRFDDGEGGFRGGLAFRLKVRDPFESDELPQWLMGGTNEQGDMAEAIYEFVERHRSRRLLRHAKRGNINGIANFVDIFTSLVKLLLVYQRRRVIPARRMIGCLLELIPTALRHWDSEEEEFEGFLFACSDSIRNTPYLQEACDESGILAHLRAAFLILQRLRAPLDNPPSRPRDCLSAKRHAMRKAISDLKLKEPKPEQVIDALRSYSVFSDEDLTYFNAEFIR